VATLRLGKSEDAAESAAALGRLRADAGDEAEAATLFREALVGLYKLNEIDP
jgi:hypothetical protein